MRGKAKQPLVKCFFTVDHPRLCGEKKAITLPKIIHVGSPPPMRGKGNSKSDPAKRLRITPAYAGKRKPTALALYASWDHPRLCGEKVHRIV